MKKTLCDCCNFDMTDVGTYFRTVAIPCHIAEPSPGYGMMMNSEIVSVSGRQVIFDLCPKCSREVHNAAFEKIKELRSKNGCS